MQINLISDCKELCKIQNEWDSLLNQSASNNVFLTWEWIFTWLSVFMNKAELMVILLRDENNTIIGIAPLKRIQRRVFGGIRHKVIEFIGYGYASPDYLDFISLKGREQEVIDGIFSFLNENRRLWDCIWLTDIPEHSPNLIYIKKNVSKMKLITRNSMSTICPYVTLPPTWSALVKTKSYYKKTIRRNIKVLEREYLVELEKISDERLLESDMKMLFELHSCKWNDSNSTFVDKINFHKELARIFLKKNWLWLFFLRVNGKRVAALYCFNYNKKVWYINSGRREDWNGLSVGTVLMAKVFQRAIEEGCEEFDLLRGSEDYKFRWTKSLRKNMKITCWKRDPKGILSFIVNNVSLKLKNMTRRIDNGLTARCKPHIQ